MNISLIDDPSAFVDSRTTRCMKRQILPDRALRDLIDEAFSNPDLLDLHLVFR